MEYQFSKDRLFYYLIELTEKIFNINELDFPFSYPSAIFGYRELQDDMQILGKIKKQTPNQIIEESLIDCASNIELKNIRSLLLLTSDMLGVRYVNKLVLSLMARQEGNSIVCDIILSERFGYLLSEVKNSTLIRMLSTFSKFYDIEHSGGKIENIRGFINILESKRKFSPFLAGKLLSNIAEREDFYDFPGILSLKLFKIIPEKYQENIVHSFLECTYDRDDFLSTLLSLVQLESRTSIETIERLISKDILARFFFLESIRLHITKEDVPIDKTLIFFFPRPLIQMPVQMELDLLSAFLTKYHANLTENEDLTQKYGQRRRELSLQTR
jgi:hypothetical protein